MTSGAQVLDDVEAFLGQFVVYPSDAARVAHTLWIAHAWRMDLWDSTPRYVFQSPEPGSGKTRGLEVTELLVPRPVMAVNVTANYLFRKVAHPDGRPTILYDEIDTVFGGSRTKDSSEDVRGWLNAGHRKGAVSGRCVVRGKTIEVEEMDAYCAVAMAGLDDLPDTIRTRSVIVKMRRRAPGETVRPFRRRECEAETETLRHALEAWTSTLSISSWPAMPDGIADRDADVWESLLAVADAAGGAWPTRARVSAVSLVSLAHDKGGSLGVRLLADLRAIFGAREHMFTAEILDALNGLDESPWGDLRGKPLDARGLARRLGRYEVAPRQVRVGLLTGKGYSAADLYDPWRRYLEETSVTDVSSRGDGLALSCGGQTHQTEAFGGGPGPSLRPIPGARETSETGETRSTAVDRLRVVAAINEAAAR